jgi:hypothetical protein
MGVKSKLALVLYRSIGVRIATHLVQCQTLLVDGCPKGAGIEISSLTGMALTPNAAKCSVADM